MEVTHEDFHCTVPLTVCTVCSDRPPFVPRHIDELVVVALLAVAAAIPAAFLAPPVILAFIVLLAFTVWTAILCTRSEPPALLTPDECRDALRGCLCKLPELHTLLAVFPEASIAIAPRVRRIPLDKVNPAELFQQNAACHEHVRVVAALLRQPGQPVGVAGEVGHRARLRSGT